MKSSEEILALGKLFAQDKVAISLSPGILTQHGCLF